MTKAKKPEVSGFITGRPLRASALALALLVLALFGGAPALGSVLPPGHPTGSAAKAAEPAAKPLDINSASKAQLKTLRGIGDAEADRIIAARPYLSKADIVANAGIPAGIYLSIKRQIVAVPKTKPNPRG